MFVFSIQEQRNTCFYQHSTPQLFQMLQKQNKKFCFSYTFVLKRLICACINENEDENELMSELLLPF